MSDFTIALAAAAVSGFCYAIWHVASPSSSRKPHPSVVKRRQEGKPVSTNQRYKLSEVPTRPDAIVIGSGPGGLTTAALLAKEGKCVVVLEQHDRAGGGMHSFEDKGYEWDTGFHYIGEMQEDSPLRGIVNHLTGDKTEWAWMGDNEFSRGAYDIAIFGDETHPMLAGRKNFREVLLAACPEEKEAIEGIMSEVEKVTKDMAFTQTLVWKTLPSCLRRLLHRCMRKPFLDISSETTLEVLHRHTRNKKLIALFTYIWGCYASPPEESSWGVHAMITAHYFNGACFPVGGPVQLVKGFIETIEAAGGRVLVNAPVDQILTTEDGERAIGVRLSNKAKDEIFAPVVVSSIGVRHTFGKLTTPQVAARCGWERKDLDDITSRDVKPGRGHVTLFCGFSVNGEEAQLPSANTWIFPKNHDHDENTKQFIRRAWKGEGEQRYVEFPGMEEFLDGGETYPYMCLAFPSEKDPSFRERFPNKSTCSLMLEVDPEMFMYNKDAAGAKSRQRGQEHANLKERFADRLLEVVFKHYPQLRDHLDVYEIGTPLCANYYLGKIHGDSYGSEYTPGFFTKQDDQIDPQTPVEGLYLSGQDVAVCGFSGAMVGGIYCASRIVSPWRMWYGLMGAMGISTVIKPAEDVSSLYSKYLPKFSSQAAETKFDPRYLSEEKGRDKSSKESSFANKTQSLDICDTDVDTISSDEEKCEEPMRYASSPR